MQKLSDAEKAELQRKIAESSKETFERKTGITGQLGTMDLIKDVLVWVVLCVFCVAFFVVCLVILISVFWVSSSNSGKILVGLIFVAGSSITIFVKSAKEILKTAKYFRETKAKSQNERSR